MREINEIFIKKSKKELLKNLEYKEILPKQDLKFGYLKYNPIVIIAKAINKLTNHLSISVFISDKTSVKSSLDTKCLVLFFMFLQLYENFKLTKSNIKNWNAAQIPLDFAYKICAHRDNYRIIFR